MGSEAASDNVVVALRLDGDVIVVAADDVPRADLRAAPGAEAATARADAAIGAGMASGRRRSEQDATSDSTISRPEEVEQNMKEVKRSDGCCLPSSHLTLSVSIVLCAV